MATSPDGSVPSSVFEAQSLYTPVAGEHEWDGAVALCPALLVPGQQLVGHCVNRVLTGWTLGLIQHQGSCYVGGGGDKSVRVYHTNTLKLYT